jgi:hypothetical protein
MDAMRGQQQLPWDFETGSKSILVKVTARY